jgi:hypothetical protein
MLVQESLIGLGHLPILTIGLLNGLRLVSVAGQTIKLMRGLTALVQLIKWVFTCVWSVMIRLEIESLISRMWWGHRKDNSRLSLELALVCR